MTPRLRLVADASRLSAFRARRPDCEIGGGPGLWAGSILISRERRVARSWSIDLLVDVLERYSVMDDIERDFADWHVWVSNHGRWWAVRRGPDAERSRDDRRPMTVFADDGRGLVAELTEAEMLGPGRTAPRPGPAFPVGWSLTGRASAS